MAKSKVAIKTAKITVYHIFGTKGSYSADVFYRGKMLFSHESNSIRESVQIANNWAFHNGFNRYAVTLN